MARYQNWLAPYPLERAEAMISELMELEGPTNDEWWMLMRDVSDGIRARGAFKESDERALLAAIARLHAHYWEGRNSLDGLPLWVKPLCSGARARPTRTLPCRCCRC